VIIVSNSPVIDYLWNFIRRYWWAYISGSSNWIIDQQNPFWPSAR
jgi:hypothetical protein